MTFTRIATTDTAEKKKTKERNAKEVCIDAEDIYNTFKV